MPTKKEAADWIRRVVSGDITSADFLNFETYHELILHEGELVKAGELNGGEPYVTKRRNFAASIPAELRQRIDDAHAAMFEHQLRQR